VGYSTDFYGKFKLSRKLSDEEYKTLVDFSEVRHGNNHHLLAGQDPEYPGFWCQWVPAEDREHLEWDGNEKFYDYVEWLELIIDKFFELWGILLNGDVRWEGEDPDDKGVISVNDSIVTITKQM
jgi:hypothetical protein